MHVAVEHNAYIESCRVSELGMGSAAQPLARGVAMRSGEYSGKKEVCEIADGPLGEVFFLW
jgi:hypothetical protein